jgi:hypothetical protein
MVIYYIRTFLQGLTKPLFKTQNRLEIRLKKFALFSICFFQRSYYDFYGLESCDVRAGIHLLRVCVTTETQTLLHPKLDRGSNPFKVRSGANPTTLSYNASVEKIYSATDSMERFYNRIIFL